MGKQDQPLAHVVFIGFAAVSCQRVKGGRWLVQTRQAQSTLSTGLKEMEERLGVQVAERTKHSVMMTPVGKELAARARGILSEVQDFEDRAERENSVGTLSIRLGTIPTVGPYLMPRAMPLLRQRLPATKF